MGQAPSLLDLDSRGACRLLPFRRQRGAVGKFGVDIDTATFARIMSKLDIAIDQSEQRMVTTNANVISRLDLRSTLADNDAASSNKLTIITFHTQHFGLAIPTIAGATHTFLMCHGLFPCLAFRLLGFLRAAPTRLLFLFYLRLRSLGYFACSCI